MDKQLSEVIGAFIGDGCFSEFMNNYKKRICSEVVFTGSWGNDSEYYINIIKPIIDSNFGSKSNPRLRKDNNTVCYFVHRNNFKNWLRTLGFTPGPKAGTVFIPEEIMSSRELSIACVRGIFNTDGCVFSRYSRKYNRHPKNYLSYAVIQFKMKSKKVIEQIIEIIEQEGIKCNNLTNCSGYWVCRITSQPDVDRFMEEFQINHNHHLKRYASIRGD